MAAENLPGKRKLGWEDFREREREPRFFDLKTVGKAGNTLRERGRRESKDAASGGGDGGGDGGYEGGGYEGVGEGGDETHGGKGNEDEDVGKGGDGDEEIEGDGGKTGRGAGLGSTVFATQSIRGLTLSSQGMPRIIACTPIEETKKVSRLGIPAMV
jgi:hypothetical protein